MKKLYENPNHPKDDWEGWMQINRPERTGLATLSLNHSQELSWLDRFFTVCQSLAKASIQKFFLRYGNTTFLFMPAIMSNVIFLSG